MTDRVCMIKPFILATFMSSLILSACSSSEQNKIQIHPEDYKVENVAQLEQRFETLNQQLSRDYQNFKKNNAIAFSDQSIFDVQQLQTLDLHAVSRTSLKPVKQAYCKMMNDYFVHMYYLGHQNINLLSQTQWPKIKNQDLIKDFSSADQFYDFILNRYTHYRQAQEIMGFGCNLKQALQEN